VLFFPAPLNPDPLGPIAELDMGLVGIVAELQEEVPCSVFRNVFPGIKQLTFFLRKCEAFTALEKTGVV
jgi:hypothetical protein